jgi:hypothetical protein
MGGIGQKESEPMELRLRGKDEEEDEAEQRGRQYKKAHEKSLGGPDAIDPQLPRFAVPGGIFVVILFRLVPIIFQPHI